MEVKQESLPKHIQIQDEGSIIQVPSHLWSRVLYTNPVCLLTVNDTIKTRKRNVMTITWITCINNAGLFFMSLNQNRFTWQLLKHQKQFVLNVPVCGMEDVLLKIGGCSGKVVDKFSELSIDICSPGWKPLNSKEEDVQQLKMSKSDLIAIQDCVAHIECKIESEGEMEGHKLLYCRIKNCWVKREYWCQGKTFIPITPNTPPYLTFLGSQTFGYVYSTAEHQPTHNKEYV